MLPHFAPCQIGSSGITSLALKFDASKQDFYFRKKICIKKHDNAINTHSVTLPRQPPRDRMKGWLLLLQISCN